MLFNTVKTHNSFVKSGEWVTDIVQKSNKSIMLSLQLVIGPYIAYEEKSIRINDC